MAVILKGVGRTCARLLGIGAVVAVALCSVAYSGQPGDLERQFLREAAQGNLQNVFLVYMFGGYVALPRTFVQLGVSGNPRYLVSLHTDSSIKAIGHATLGLFTAAGEGKRKDVQTGSELPSSPSRAEQHGKLTVEYFSPGTGAHPPAAPAVLIRDDSSYVLLTGSAVGIADDLAETYVALAGPPDIFSGNWQKGAHGNGSSSRSAGTVARANESEDPESCDSRAFRAFPLYSGAGAGMRIRIRVQSGTDPAAFQQTGFAPDDFIVAIDGQPLRPEDDLHHWMREAAHGRAVRFSVQRGGSSADVVLQPESARRALGQCLK